MENNKFENPITVRVAPAGTLLTLRTARETSDFLLNKWPGKRSEKHRAALQACSDVNLGNKPAIGARRAFVAAAREAGIFFDEKLERLSD
jgi:hypothetical protein